MRMFMSFYSVFIKLVLITGLIVSPITFAQGKPKEIYWEDLIPKGHVQVESTAQANHEGTEQNWIQPNLDAPTVPALDGQLVSLPGFVVPLEGDDENITEFLLVPFFGACIHVPPPPPNQIVHVIIKDGVPIDSLYDAIVVTGKLSTKGWSGEIAQVGYTMSGIGVAPFEL